MKGAGKIILSIAFVSAMCLFYVHEQISLLRVSYLIDHQSEVLAQQTELYRQLKFEVEQLRAPRLLEEKMKQLSLDLTLPKEFRVIPVPASQPVESSVVEDASTKPASDGLMQFFGHWVNVAQAKTDS